MAQFSFDSSNVPVNSGSPLPIPKGKYRAIIIASEIKPTSNGTGAYIEAQFRVIDPPHDGHIIYHNFNIRNQSQKAMEIGYGQLSAVCHAVGVLQIQDTTQLHNRPLTITVKVGGGGARPEGGTYEERNEITNFAAAEAVQAQQPANFAIPGQQPQFTPPPATNFAQPTATQPWEQPAPQAPAAPAASSMPWEQPTTQIDSAPTQAMPWQQSNPIPQQQPAPQQTAAAAPMPNPNAPMPWMKQ